MEMSQLLTTVFSARINKPGTALAAGALAMGLLLGTSLTQAADVEIVNGNVIRITNLELNLDQEQFDGLYNVEFINGTGLDIYGSDTGPFDVRIPEDGASVILQINNALNANETVPTGASSAGTDQFFIPAIEYFGLWASFGSENIFGNWTRCDLPDCLIGGTAVLQPDDTFTYARFTVADSPGNQPPTADADGPYSGAVGIAVDFDGSASDDPDGDIVAYDWDYGDDSPVDINAGPKPSHTYESADVYNVTLTVTDSSDATDSAGTTVNIDSGNLPPTANAGGPYSGTVDVAVDFDGSASDDPEGDIVAYDWDYGDDSPLDINAGPKPSHTYESAGEYNVTLTVTDANDVPASAGTTASIDSGDQPPTGVEIENGNVIRINNLELNLDNNELDGFYNVEFINGTGLDIYGSEDGPFDFPFAEDAASVIVQVNNALNTNDTVPTGASSAGTDQFFIPAIEYFGLWASFGGQFFQPLGVPGWDACELPGCISGIGVLQPDGIFTYAKFTVAGPPVNQPPTADAGGSYTGTVGVAVPFDGRASDDPDGDIVQYDWDYGDGSPVDFDAGPTPSYTYESADIYSVILTVTDNGGATDTAGTTATIGGGAPSAGIIQGMMELLLLSDTANVVKVFVTSLSYKGNFPGGLGLAGADAACTTAANDASLPGTWTAWLSDNDTDAVDRIFNAGTSYQLVDGTVIADSLADLLDGTLDAPIIVMETGDAIPGGALAVWTNTDANGTKGGGGTCDNWTLADDSQVGRIGLADQTDETWTNSGGGQPCDVFNRLYCFADQVVPVEN